MRSRVSGWCAARRATPTRRRHQSGQATVELALVTPFVVMLLLLIVQLGLVVRDYVRVSHAAREAARAAAVDPGDGRARDAVRHLLGDAELQLERSGRIGEPVTARVSYRSRTDVPIIGALLPDVTIVDSTTMRSERV